MRIRRIVLALIGLFFVAGVVFFYVWSQPRVMSVHPSDGTDPVPAASALRITFSHPMQADSLVGRLSIDPPVSGQTSWEEQTLVFTPDQPWPSGQLVTVRLAPGSRSAGLLPLTLRQEMSWSFTVGHPLLLYLYPSEAAADLYLLDPRSGEIEQLTSGLGAVIDYSPDPSGEVIILNTSLGNGGSAIYRLQRASGDVQLLLECPEALCRYPRLSPRGDYVAYERTPLSANAPEVWLMPLPVVQDEGAISPARPFLFGPPDHRTQQPHWSPDGLLTYYDFTLSAFIVQDVQSRQVASFSSQTGIPGAWDPAGEVYVFPEIFIPPISENLAGLEDITFSRLLQFHLDGSSQDLTGTDDVEDSSPVFSPGGQVLAFARKYLDVARWTPGRQIWIMNADGAQARPLTGEPYHNHYDLAWSPDGAQLAYVRFNKDALIEPPELWMMNADGTGATRLVTSGYLPQWIQ